MCDKVQLRKDDCETSLFHHGLVKFLVLDGLQKIGRDWNSFIFMAGFQSKTGLTPQPVREVEKSVDEEMADNIPLNKPELIEDD